MIGRGKLKFVRLTKEILVQPAGAVPREAHNGTTTSMDTASEVFVAVCSCSKAMKIYHRIMQTLFSIQYQNTE